MDKAINYLSLIFGILGLFYAIYNVIQAIETFHRRTRKNFVLEKGTFQKMRNEIFLDLAPKDPTLANNIIG
jgi:hypothetical protein